MTDEPTNKTDTDGEKTDTPVQTFEKTEVEKVKDTLEELKSANDEIEKELLRKEKLRAKMIMGGKTEAGKVNEKKETDEDIANKFSSGELNLL